MEHACHELDELFSAATKQRNGARTIRAHMQVCSVCTPAHVTSFITKHAISPRTTREAPLALVFMMGHIARSLS
jgi:hypothetical protein